METEYKKLPGLYNSLWAHFSEVKNKQDSAALRQALSPKMQVTAMIPLEENEEAECFSNKTSPNHSLPRRGIDRHLKKRDEFYTALTDFTNCMKVALQSASYFNDKSFENKRQHYKDTLKMFVNLRKQVREDADETVNYDEYEEDIRQLLDKHIGGVKIKEAEGAYLVGNLGKDVKPNELSEQARHATSRNSGTPVAIIRSPTQRMGDAMNALRPQRLRTKAASSLLPHWQDVYSECNSCSSRVLLAHVESANCPVAYQGLKITTSLSSVSMIFSG